ncbi:Gfo/Idh/MocA family protein [Paenibacillus sepulcri]|uniref:Gfo/Idh/MocA family oxidoreductase n=1 Tax=Paenibacillus sepulcri TaxID=359917 RepID=A0ABS7CFJ1_9BACL|nr:Gfo/Idh/MocA family oxidoreductase [Paenibacillus sepulcri]
MKAILVGLGSAGYSWYKRLRDRGLLAAVVEADPAMKDKMDGDSFPFYTSLEEALAHEEAGFLVNVTSPASHTQVNHAAFDRGLPVLCEKPISFDYPESIGIVARAAKENIPFMIAENYRRFPYVRKMKQLLDEDSIGAISSIDISFRRYHRVQRKYAVRILDDIGVHHFDMLRYLTGQEGRAVQAKLYNPPGGWEEEGAVQSANAIIEMDGGIIAGYAATIASRGPQTQWSGDWRIEGTRGAMVLTGKEIRLYDDDGERLIPSCADVIERDTLTDFLISLETGREAESSGSDYLLTQALVHYTNLSGESGGRMPVELPDLGKVT